MADAKKLEAHLFICTHQRENGECCAAKGSLELLKKLKGFCKDEAKGWKGRVRVNAAGCLGRCDEGIAAVLYPQAEWLTHLHAENSVEEVEKLLRSVLDRKNEH